MNLTDTIAMLQGFLWLANYDPTNFYPLGPKEENEEKQIAIEDDSTIKAPTLYNIFFNPERYYDKRIDYSIAS